MGLLWMGFAMDGFAMDDMDVAAAKSNHTSKMNHTKQTLTNMVHCPIS